MPNLQWNDNFHRDDDPDYSFPKPKSKKEAIQGGILIAIFLFFVVLIIIGMNRNDKLMFIGFGGFVVLALGLMIFQVLKQRHFMREPSVDCTPLPATVVACRISSNFTYLHLFTKKPDYVERRVYEVTVLLDGENFVTYSRTKFTPGTPVTVYVRDNPKKYCYIQPV